MPSKKLGEFLSSAPEIGRLVPQAAELLEIRQALRELLPETMRGFCDIARVKQGSVVIFAENNATAAKLRLIGPTIVNEMRRRGLKVTGIEPRVQGAKSRPAQERRAAVELSSAAGEALDRLSASLPESRLRTAIRSLARKART
jgi:hypothetical protein